MTVVRAIYRRCYLAQEVTRLLSDHTMLCYACTARSGTARSGTAAEGLIDEGRKDGWKALIRYYR